MDVPRAAAGIDLPALRDWFAVHIADFIPVSANQIAGGNSNITVRLSSDDGRDLVLRRPPLHSVLATAHDMGREYRLISAFGPTALPVPRAVTFCPDADVVGAPFYVMEFVPGIVLHDQQAARAIPRALRTPAAFSFVDALASLHGADIDEIGLGDLAKREGYIARQLKRWYSQFEQSRTSDDDTIRRAHDLLASAIPEQRDTSVVHGDFRMGNCIVNETGEVQAVLDWEISTLGDPLADVGYVLATWPRTEAEAEPFPDSPSLVEGFPARSALLERYVERSGRDVSSIDYYVAFAYFRAACITQGVYFRMLSGAQGIGTGAVEQFGHQAEASARFAAEHAEAL